MLTLANDEKMECNLETVCYLRGGTFNWEDKHFA